MDARYQSDNLIFLRIVSNEWPRKEVVFEVQEHKDYPDSTREFIVRKTSLRRLVESLEPGDIISVAQEDYASEVADEVECPALDPRALLKRIEALEETIVELRTESDDKFRDLRTELSDDEILSR